MPITRAAPTALAFAVGQFLSIAWASDWRPLGEFPITGTTWSYRPSTVVRRLVDAVPHISADAQRIGADGSSSLHKLAVRAQDCGAERGWVIRMSPAGVVLERQPFDSAATDLPALIASTLCRAAVGVR